MKQKTRYNVRLAVRRKVVVRHGDESDLEAFYFLYRETAARDGFGIRTRDYYLDAWSCFCRDGRAAVILAEREGELLAGVLPVAFGDTAYFLYGATASSGREHMAGYLAQWESLKWSLASGCRRYDWWGGPSTLDSSDPLWGVYRYKVGFGAVLVEQLGAHDRALKGTLYVAYNALRNLRDRYLRLRGSRAEA
jgi:lipid II:glycine glycyltransferase (peptidoglycan interpeptide bridge formation enzyme)